VWTAQFDNERNISIIGGIQPSEVAKYVAEAYSFDNSDGFLQRFQLPIEHRNARPEKPTEGDYLAMQKGSPLPILRQTCRF